MRVNVLAAVGLLGLGLPLLVAAPAWADAKTEQQARALQKKAIEEDYLTTEFSKAEERLYRAVALCGADKCSTQLRAQLRRDLGVVEVGGQLDREKGIANFAEAVRLDPTITLDPDLKTRELEQAFDQARLRAGGGAGAGTRTGPTPLAPGQVPPPKPVSPPAAAPPEAPVEPPKRAYPRFWLGAGVGFEFLVLPAGSDVCKLNDSGPSKYEPKNDLGYYCTNPDGSDYPPRNDSSLAENGKIPDGKGGNVQHGIAPSNLRIWLSFDYALNANFLLGARIGLVLRTFPGNEPTKDGHVLLAPFHAEARLTYLIGKMAILQTAAPYVFFASGVSQFDANVEAPVAETGDPAPRSIQAWEIAGPWFVSGGGGVRVALGDAKNVALLLGGRANLTLPIAKSPVAASFGPELQFQVGF